MPLGPKAARAAAERIAEIAEGALRDWQLGRVEQEPQLTDRILGAIAAVLRHTPIAGVYWDAFTLGDRGRNSTEKKFGADALLVVDLDLRTGREQKGVLVQAKIEKESRGLPPRDFARLRGQCDDMLATTSQSYTFLYHPQGIFVVPATAICAASSQTGVLSGSGRIPLVDFLQRLFECRYGDRVFRAATKEELVRAARRRRTRNGLLLKARD